MSKLAILENDLEFSRKLLNYIVGHNKKVRLANIAITPEEMLEALKLLKEEDILLLDLNVLEINIDELTSILKKKRKCIPYIIVIADNKEQYEKFKNYIYASIKKTCSFSRIVSIINKITHEAEEKFYERLVTDELNKFEINVTTRGYDYIVDAVKLSLKDETLLKDMQNKLYKLIASKNNLPNSDNVKWAVEKCVKSTIRYTDSNITKPYFHVEASEKITPKLFINMVGYNLKSRMEDEMDA